MVAFYTLAGGGYEPSMALLCARVTCHLTHPLTFLAVVVVVVVVLLLKVCKQRVERARDGVDAGLRHSDVPSAWQGEQTQKK